MPTTREAFEMGGERLEIGQKLLQSLVHCETLSTVVERVVSHRQRTGLAWRHQIVVRLARAAPLDVDGLHVDACRDVDV